MINSGRIAQSDKDQLRASSEYFVNFTCPHSAKDIDGGEGEPAIGRPTERIKARLDALGITADAVVCNGDWGSLQSFTQVDQDAERPKIQDDINNGGLNGKMVSIVGNHIAAAGNLNHFNLSVWQTLDRVSFPYTLNYDVTADYEFERFYFLQGNNIHICMSDRNDVTFPYGKDGSTGSGGHPNGCLTLDTIKWLQDLLVRYSDYNSFIYVHEGIAETTVATGYGDGTEMGHNPFPVEDGSGNIYTILDGVTAYNQTAGNNWFKNALGQWSGMFQIVSQGHSHGQPGFSISSRGLDHEEGGAYFFNAGTAGRNHSYSAHENDPHFTILEFQPGLKEMMIHRVSIDGQQRYGISQGPGLVPSFRRSRLLKTAYAQAYAPSAISRPTSVASTVTPDAGGDVIGWTTDADYVLVLHNDSTTPHIPIDGECPYPHSFEVNGDRVVYLGPSDNASFTDDQTGGNYRVIGLNGGGGNCLYLSS